MLSISTGKFNKGICRVKEQKGSTARDLAVPRRACLQVEQKPLGKGIAYLLQFLRGLGGGAAPESADLSLVYFRDSAVGTACIQKEEVPSPLLLASFLCFSCWLNLTGSKGKMYFAEC